MGETVEVTVFFDDEPEAKASMETTDVQNLVFAIWGTLNEKIPSTYVAPTPQNPTGQFKPVVNVVPTKPHKPNEMHRCLEFVDGSLALELNVTAPDVWNQLSVLQDEIYDPDSVLSRRVRTQRMKLHPCRAYVSEARVSYDSVSEVHKEEAHMKLAAIAAKQTFFRLAKLEITTREALADAFKKAEESKDKLEKMAGMFDEIAATSSDPDHIKRGMALMRSTHAAVQESSRLVSVASEKAIEFHNLTEQSKMAAYFCAARTGVSESYQDWARREFVFTYLPKTLLPDDSKSKFADERDKAIQAEIRAEVAKTRLSLVEKNLKDLESAAPSHEVESQTQRLRKEHRDAQRLVDEEREKAKAAANVAIQLYQTSINQVKAAAPAAPAPPPAAAAAPATTSAPVIGGNPSSSKPQKPLYVCSLGTGFVGTYEEVDAHEKRVLAERATKAKEAGSSPSSHHPTSPTPTATTAAFSAANQAAARSIFAS